MSQPATTGIAALTIDCDDAAAVARFYTDAFGGRADPDSPQLDCVRVDGLLVLFRELDGWTRPPWPGPNIQLHLEVHVDDLQRSEARMLALGATKPQPQDLSDPGLPSWPTRLGTPSASSSDQPQTPDCARTGSTGDVVTSSNEWAATSAGPQTPLGP